MRPLKCQNCVDLSREAAVRNCLVAAILLVAFGATEALAQRPDLSGTWTCRGGCQIPDGMGTIEQSGRSVVCTNEAGQISNGTFTSNRSVSCWGLHGQISEDRRVINWGNGTRWVRYPTR